MSRERSESSPRVGSPANATSAAGLVAASDSRGLMEEPPREWRPSRDEGDKAASESKSIVEGAPPLEGGTAREAGRGVSEPAAVAADAVVAAVADCAREARGDNDRAREEASDPETDSRARNDHRCAEVAPHGV